MIVRTLPAGEVMGNCGTVRRPCASATAVPKADEMFVVLPNTYRVTDAKVKANPGTRMTSVDVLNPDGTVKRTVIWQCTAGAIPRVDTKGNIYLAEPVRPVGRAFPEFFDGKIKPPGKTATYRRAPDSF